MNISCHYCAICRGLLVPELVQHAAGRMFVALLPELWLTELHHNTGLISLQKSIFSDHEGLLFYSFNLDTCMASDLRGPAMRGGCQYVTVTNIRGRASGLAQITQHFSFKYYPLGGLLSIRRSMRLHMPGEWRAQMQVGMYASGAVAATNSMLAELCYSHAGRNMWIQ